MRRSIFDLRAAPAAKLDDLKAFVDRFGGLNNLAPRWLNVRDEAMNRTIAQFIAIRACLRMPLP